MGRFEGIRVLPCICFILFLSCTIIRADSILTATDVSDGVTHPIAEEPARERHLQSTIDKMREEILAIPESSEDYGLRQYYPPGCFVNGKNLCLEAPAAVVRDYLRNLAARLAKVINSPIDYTEPSLRQKLNKLGCLSVAVIDLPEVQATVGLFSQGVVSRLRLDKGTMGPFAARCKDRLLPVTFHQHEKALYLPKRGQINRESACSEEYTGGHHDPGLACGPTGASICSRLDIPPSSALKGTEFFSGEYSCSPEIYAKRPFACHAGDISGKHGVGVDATPDQNKPDFRLIAFDTHADNPCVSAELRQSLVLHCHSTNYRLACAPFQRVETAGKGVPDLLREMIRTASVTVPYAKSQKALLAGLNLISEVEQRLSVLESVAREPGAKPEEAA